MTSNPTIKTAITNDLRSKVIQKFRALHSKLQTTTPPEQLEKTCFDKANNDQDTYLRLCNNLVSNRAKQLENAQGSFVVNNQVRAVMNSNFRPSIVGQNNNGTVSDPINALQNLTVTAGQVNQMNMQQNNQQITYRLNQPNMIQMTPNSQIHQRMMIAGNRPMDHFSMQQQPHITQSPSPQMMPSQIQLQTMNSMNVTNTGGTIRIINKNGAIRPEPTITQTQTMQATTYSMDSNGGQMNNQHIGNVIHTSIVRPPVTRIVSNSPSTTNLTQHQSPQEHYSISNSQISQNHVTPSNSSVVQSEEMSHHQNISSNNAPNPQQAAASVSQRVEISEEESIKVKEEMAKLSAKYFRYLSLALEHPFDTPAEVIKVWKVLKDVLDTSKVCDKPITLKHVAKIQLYSEKAAQHVIQKNIGANKSPAQVSEEVSGKRILLDRNKSSFIPEPVGTGIDALGGSNHTNSLDFAFADVIHKINKQKPDHKRSVQRNLVRELQTNRQDCLHFLPKHMQADSDNSDTKEMDFNEHEFDFIDHVSYEGVFYPPFSVTNPAFDQSGYLRIDRNLNNCIMNSVDVKKEIELLQEEFDIVELNPQLMNADWSSGDSDWENSKFYSIKIKNDNLPVDIPSIFVRIPDDYEHSSSVDWNLNLAQYKNGPNSEINIFMSDVKKALEDEFSSLSTRPWNGIPLLDIISIYVSKNY